jgi:hypothetical protein
VSGLRQLQADTMGRALTDAELQRARADHLGDPAVLELVVGTLLSPWALSVTK